MRILTVMLFATGCAIQGPWKSSLERGDHSIVEEPGRCDRYTGEPGIVACRDHQEEPSAGALIGGTVLELGALALLGMVGAVANAPVH